MSKTSKAAMVILFMLVFLSLGLNLYLIWQLLKAQQQVQAVIPRIQQTLAQAATDVETFQGSKIEFEIDINENFPVDVKVPFKETIEVPIQMTIPIKQQFEATIQLDPFRTGAAIPLDVTVPVDVEVPVDIVIPVFIDRTIPISTTIPLNMSLPIAVDLNETNLAGSVEKLHSALVSFNQFFDEILVGIQ